jgi:hypothetical protein
MQQPLPDATADAAVYLLSAHEAAAARWLRARLRIGMIAVGGRCRRTHRGWNGNADDHPVGGDPAVPDHGPARQHPVLPELLKNVAPKRRRAVMVRELLIALGVLLVFLLGGQHILKLLQLKEESISIAGGIVLFLIGIRMVFPPADGGGIFGKAGEGEPFIVPMAIPGVAGPSAMAALLLLTNTRARSHCRLGDRVGAARGLPRR